ncbi:hypothetical protein BCR39DRAFT_505766 [Naematelia encephala]|uniref:Nitrogen regulatory protein areA GATA-like domain-containing protein n=1 Tax=Naematelia encephala TaxID=71784 RepID=A0A1Y2B1Z0_9TREE|nr:hypothetical protein BCR39DRAFT_505766 [Naematelia encephala]
MAQVIPSITSLPLDSHAAPSVEDIQVRRPSICVDYLSHNWEEEDVWASWRSMTRHKHEIANGVRLENASWRTWQKQRNKLKTISPETLNWLKDSDVTWLYGPLHTAQVEVVPPRKVATTVDRLGIDRPADSGMKPILKHRTLSEMLAIATPSSPILEAASLLGLDEDVDGHDDGDRPHLLQTKSDTNIVRRAGGMRKKSPTRQPIAHASSKGTLQDASGSQTPEAPSGKKHISFNTFVEQCMAIDDPTEIQSEDESDDEMLEMRSSSTSVSSRSSRPSISRNSSSNSSDHLTIAKIAPTMLKTPGGSYPSTAPQMIYQPPAEYLSPTQDQQPQVSPHLDFPSPQQTRSKWNGDDDDEYGSVGFDYFGGPDLGGEPRSPQAPAHVGQPYARPPTVAPAPPQPKWRQPASEPSSSGSSSPGLSGNPVVSPPQPARSILKVRPPGTTPPNAVEPSSPPNSYFNYNPSAATGIGGMRASGAYNYEAGSPLLSPATEETRGRSASRDRGSSIYDRSSSRGTSVSSQASISPGAQRSPVENGAKRAHLAAPQLDKVNEHVPWSKEQNGNQPMDIDEYVPERSTTPTPHSSPQITFRPLKDTSPASLPHHSTRNLSSSSLSSNSSGSRSQPPTPASDLPKADPPTTLPARNAPSNQPPIAQTRSSSGGHPTIAHVGTNAQPTISQPPAGADDSGALYFSGAGSAGGEAINDQGDGSSIMGRAANIANSARDLLGTLWYGGQAEQQGVRQVSGGGVAAGPSPSGHRRGQSS